MWNGVEWCGMVWYTVPDTVSVVFLMFTFTITYYTYHTYSITPITPIRMTPHSGAHMWVFGCCVWMFVWKYTM